MKLWSEPEMSRYLLLDIGLFRFGVLKIDRYNALCLLLFNEETISFIFLACSAGVFWFSLSFRSRWVKLFDQNNESISMDIINDTTWQVLCILVEILLVYAAIHRQRTPF